MAVTKEVSRTSLIIKKIDSVIEEVVE